MESGGEMCTAFDTLVISWMYSMVTMVCNSLLYSTTIIIILEIC